MSLPTRNRISGDIDGKSRVRDYHGRFEFEIIRCPRPDAGRREIYSITRADGRAHFHRLSGVGVLSTCARFYRIRRGRNRRTLSKLDVAQYKG